MSTSWPAALLLSLGLIASTLIASQTYFTVKSFENSISVTGTAERTVTSDRVKWTAGFTRSTGLDPKAGNADLQKDLVAVKQLLHDRGIGDSEVTVQPPTATPVCEGQGSYGYDKLGQNCGANRTIGYTLQQTFIVESNDVDKITKLSQEASGVLANSGVLFTTGGIEYYYSKLNDLKLDMLSEATNNAQGRAQKILEAAHSRVGGLQSAGMGVFQITPVNSTEVSDYGMYDTSSIEKKITAIVHATFKLQQ